MANTLITPPELDSNRQEDPSQTRRRPGLVYGSDAGSTFRDSGGPDLGQPKELEASSNPFQSLIQNFRDAFFPEKLPPLQLESRPIAVKDPMAVQRDPMSTAIAVGVHVLAFLLIIWLSAKAIKKIIAPPKTPDKVITFNDVTPPPPVLPRVVKQSSGGGGGQHDIAPASKGAPPKFSLQPQIVPPSAPPKIQPKLAVEPTIVADPRNQMKSNLPNLGMVNGLAGPNVSMGTGNGSGIGSGNGAGYGSGSGYNIGGGVPRAGQNGVGIPKVIYQVDADFSEEARKAKFQANPVVSLIVDASGHPQQVQVLHPVGMGLDEKAVEAVRQWRFQPATKDGHPIACRMAVEVNFQIF